MIKKVVCIPPIMAIIRWKIAPPYVEVEVCYLTPEINAKKSFHARVHNFDLEIVAQPIFVKDSYPPKAVWSPPVPIPSILS